MKITKLETIARVEVRLFSHCEACKGKQLMVMHTTEYGYNLFVCHPCKAVYKILSLVRLSDDELSYISEEDMAKMGVKLMPACVVCGGQAEDDHQCDWNSQNFGQKK